MADIEEVRKKIDRLILEKGLNYRDVSLKIGRKDSYIQQYVKYRYPRRLKEIDRMRLAKLLDVDDTEIMDDEIIASKTVGTPDAKLEVISNIIKASSSADDNLVSIDVLSPKINDENSDLLQNVIGHQLLSKSTFDDLYIEDVNTVKIVKITNDSMSPTINIGDFIWFDSSYTIPEADGLYLLKNGRELSVKRIQTSPIGNSIDVSGDNPQYKSYQITDKNLIKVVGKVLFVFRKL